MYFLHLGYDWSLCLAQLAPAYWCDFDVVSSGLPPPFPSLRLSPLVASAVSGLRTLFVWFCFFCFCYPTTICFSIYSLHQSSLSDPSPCLYPAGAYCFVWKVRDSNPRWRRFVRHHPRWGGISFLPSTTRPTFLFLCAAS